MNGCTSHFKDNFLNAQITLLRRHEWMADSVSHKRLLFEEVNRTQRNCVWPRGRSADAEIEASFVTANNIWCKGTEGNGGERSWSEEYTHTQRYTCATNDFNSKCEVENISFYYFWQNGIDVHNNQIVKRQVLRSVEGLVRRSSNQRDMSQQGLKSRVNSWVNEWSSFDVWPRHSCKDFCLVNPPPPPQSLQRCRLHTAHGCSISRDP